VRQRDYGLWLDTKLKGQMTKWSVRAADRTVAPSRAFADEIERWTGVLPAPFATALAGIFFFEARSRHPRNSRRSWNGTEMNCACYLSVANNYYRN
jgi:hypothetical protein